MNKAELVSRMAEKSELTKKEAEMALNALMESIQEAGERSRRQRRSYCWPWASITSPHRATCAAGYRPTSSPRPTTKASTYYPTAPASGSTPAACCAITVIFRAASAWSSSPAKHSSKSAATKNARSSSKPTT